MSNNGNNYVTNQIILFDNLCYEENNIEYWYARDLMGPLGYVKYEHFEDAIERAKQSCISNGHPINAHFINVQRPVDIGSGACRTIDDVMLTRYACYLIALNGDPRKPEIAFAQNYFIQQTRKQELIENSLACDIRIIARDKLKDSEKTLSHNLYNHGVGRNGIARVRSAGDEAFFGGYNTKDMKERLGVPDNRSLADFAQKVVLVGKEFANTLTSAAIEKENLYGEEAITDVHVNNNLHVRKDITDIGIYPEDLPPAEDIRVLEKRVNKEKRELLGNMVNEIETNSIDEENEEIVI